MNKLAILAVLLLLPQLVSAKVYMCVDHETGAASFTDQACDTSGTREEVQVKATNLDSGKRYQSPAKRKTWRSQEDTRKSGLDYNAERRDFYENRATASSK